jgi:hypothetical protein
MAKSKKQIEEVKETLYPAQDASDMLVLFKTAAPTNQQVARVMELYRKYINPNQPGYRSCGACDGTYSKIFSALREWYSKNASKFEKI